MRYEELDMIERITGCGKPCNYLEYKFHGGKHPTSFPGDHIIFSFYALTRYTWIWREEVFYPSSTMVAEVGGILSLFIGVSFMTIWDGAILVKKYVFALKSYLKNPWIRSLFWEIEYSVDLLLAPKVLLDYLRPMITNPIQPNPIHI